MQRDLRHDLDIPHCEICGELLDGQTRFGTVHQQCFDRLQEERDELERNEQERNETIAIEAYLLASQF